MLCPFNDFKECRDDECMAFVETSDGTCYCSRCSEQLAYVVEEGLEGITVKLADIGDCLNVPLTVLTRIGEDGLETIATSVSAISEALDDMSGSRGSR